MKKKTILSTALALTMFALSSCGKMDYGYHSDNFATIDRNGDLLRYDSGTGLGYDDVTIKGSFELYDKDIAAGQDFFLLFSRPTCSHCVALEPTFVDFALRSGLKIYCDPLDSNGVPFVNWIDSYENGGLDSIKQMLATPVVHLIKSNKGKPTAEYKDFSKSASSGETLSTYFSKQLNRTNIYHFSTLGGLEAYRRNNQESLYYLSSGLNDSFYWDEVYDMAKKSRKNLAFINISLFSDVDKDRLASMFPSSHSEDYLYLDGENSDAVSFRSEKEKAKKVISAYYK
ncbi:MAG: hypothetical protein J6328_00500 [Bacilli bacterium]|nr:hypothetical protein [Bacilli bacterium]